jgi:site-specific DNA-methyltransferase (adenine-specific)
VSDALIVHGDCIAFLRTLADASVDAVVTDPPAGIAFMGKAWDRMRADGMTELQAFQEFIRDVFTEVYRVLKPGGHAVVWALPRTSHHTAMGIERAGFDIRDNGTYLFHVFGTGFPKSHNLDGEWEGWGTALKPAVEFWILARKPLDGTVAESVQQYGTGALNIDGCRITTQESDDIFAKNPHTRGGFGHANATVYGKSNGATDYDPAKGRWPAHLVLDEGAAAMLDEQSGTLSVTGKRSQDSKERWSDFSAPIPLTQKTNRKSTEYPGDKGGASRFFYVAKASTKDKDEGLDAFATKTPGEKTDRADGTTGISPYAGSRGPSKNIHPTVKPTSLMSWLVRLVTPPGGVVLDPFMGSGSTGKAAILEGFDFVGCEKESEYVEIARHRIAAALKRMPDVVRLASCEEKP